MGLFAAANTAAGRAFAGVTLVAAVSIALGFHQPARAAAERPAGAPQPGATQRMSQPNVLLILVDDLPWPDVSTYGLHRVQTPNIDRIAREGVAFTNGYVVASVCAVSRAGLLTGRSPQRFGFDYNLDDSANQRDGLPVGELTLGDRLRAIGYHTGIIGKWHLGEDPQFYPTRRGFDEFFGFLAGETVYVDPKTPGIVSTHTAVDRTFDHRKPSSRIVEGPDARVVNNFNRYLTSEITDRAVDYIARNRHQPFFLYLAYNAPHWPLQVPQRYYDRFANIRDPIRRTFVAMIAALDEGIGRVLDEVEKDGLRERTLVIFLSDNGCPSQFGFCDCSHPLGAGKFTYLEGGTRVPFMMAWPGHLKPHAPVDTPVSSLDIVPTVLRAAEPGAASLTELEGRDLVSQVDRTGTAPGRAVDSAAAMPRTLFWGQEPLFAARSGRWKLFKSLDQKRLALFDLEADPAEEHDVSGSEPQRVRALDAALEGWRRQLPKPLWPLHQVGEVQVCGRETERVY
jgi:arylsulfatase A-like enzyme